MKRPLALLPLIVAVLLPFASVQACGPFFSDDVFVHKTYADHPADYAAGKLGIILATFSRADLTVAWRYLRGGRLSNEEQRSYLAQPSGPEQPGREAVEDAAQMQAAASAPQYSGPSGPADVWLKARARYAAPQPAIHAVKEYDTIYRAGYILAGQYENCQADAFRVAAATLESRAQAWGARSDSLADWIKGQDAVFSNCSSGSDMDYSPQNKPVIQRLSPSPVAAGAPILLQQDRAYQIAAAQFYAAQFAAARASFQSIAHNPSSPWRGVAAYIVARTLIREAFLTAKNGPDDPHASFNPDLMRQAQRQLESIRGADLPGLSPHAAQSLLNFVRLRTEPEARLHELAEALAGPKPDSNFTQDLIDFDWCLDGHLDSLPIREDADDDLFKVDKPKDVYTPLTPQQKQPGFKEAFKASAGLRSSAPLVDWLVTIQSPANSATAHALAEWERTSSTPWLLAALIKASPSDSAVPALLAAAQKIPDASPAWATIEYHRLRLLIETGRAAEARTEVDAALPAIRAIGSQSDENLFTALRMRTAATLNDALSDAPRKILERTSEEQSSLDECLDVIKDPKRKYDCKPDTSPVEFSGDAASIFNGEMPLSTLAQAAQSTSLSPQLRQSVSMVTWVRSVLLGNEAVAAQMLPLLPLKLQQQAGSGVGFHPLLAIARNPGLRPYLDDGVQRSASWDFIESYGDNWWCSGWTSPYDDNNRPTPSLALPFLDAATRQSGEEQTAALQAMNSAEENLGAQIVDYAHQHPNDPDVPEALFLTLRMIRYGCYRQGDMASQDPNIEKIGAIAREVGAIMRKQYSSNPWTRKAAPYVWPVDNKN
jgi:hypothetical protein